jgi:hypothetical protein
MTIRSNPPGAQVYVDDHAIGNTPVSTAFTFYGTRNIRLVRDGYETLNVKQRILPAWYEIPPLDLISDNFWPFELRDERELDFQLAPQRIVPTDQLLSRAENLRRGTQAGYISPLPNASPAQIGTPAAPPAAPQSLPPPSRLPPPYSTPADSPPIDSSPSRLPPPEGVPPGVPYGGQPGPTQWRPPAVR